MFMTSDNSQNNTPRLPFRGLMLDAARLIESVAYYRRFIDFCSAWKINTVIFRLTDDQGCAMRFRSHPELVTHANALTPTEVSELASYATERGIELIPEIESLGHSHYITRTAEHGDLNDQGTGGFEWANALIPLHPKTLQIMDDLYTEATALFPSRYLHAGCDETNWGGSDFSRQLLTTRTRAQVWGEYLNSLRAMLQRLDREMIIWDDMVLQHDPTILDYLDKRIILHDWEYAGDEPNAVSARLALAREKRFRTIGGPALHWCKWGPRVGSAQLANIDSYADVYRNTADNAVMGVIVTNWVPSRYLRDAIWDGLAYAAVAINEGSTGARMHALPQFVAEHYGARWDEIWSAVFTAIYDAAPTRFGDQPVALLIPWANEEELRQAIAAAPLPSLSFCALLPKLDALQQHIQRNQADFAAFRLSIEYLAHLYWRHSAVNSLTGQELAPVLREVARRDAALAAKLSADWQSGRTGTPSAWLTLAETWGFSPEDFLHARFMTAAAFSEQVAQKDSFRQDSQDSKQL